MIRKAAAVLMFLLFLAALGQAAQPPGPSTPEGILSFARALLAGGESFRAVTEYQRFLYHFPDHPNAPKAWEGLGRAYAEAGRWSEAAAAFRQLLRVAPGDEARWLLGAALYRGEQYQDAANILLVPEATEPEANLGTLALLRAGRAADLPPPARADLARAYAELPSKSPALAGTLSAIVPGAGHLYADRPRDALISFALNGAFLWGTYESARRELWAVAGILGFLEAGWYSGNVISAVNAAHKWNRREQGRFLRQWEDQAVPRWGLVALPGGVGAAISWRW